MAYMTFQEVDRILASRDAVFIRNTSPPPRKILVIDYPSAEGNKGFFVPRTNVPFNICDYVDPESLRSSSAFRSMLNSGMLEVITQQEAQEELADPARRQNFQNAYNEANKTYQHRADELRKTQEANASVRAEEQAASSQGMKNVIASMDPNLAKALNITGADGIKHDPKLLVQRNARLVGLETRLKAGSIPSSLLMGELSLMLGDLSIDDLQSIAAGGIWPTDAAQWARERIAFETQRLNRQAR
jgi:hypothetical protein